MTLANSRGKLFYGRHFYPGVAEYRDKAGSYRVFLNSDTIRKMDATFQGCPLFVLHVDEVDSDIDALKRNADGWVVRSFYNQADGKHWAEFMVLGEEAEKAILNKKMRLSNCYMPTRKGPGGTWNGVSYDLEILDGKYEHLALVPDPRYNESVVMNAEQFEKYNEQQLDDIKKFSNSNDNDEGKSMKLTFFKREKVQNSEVDFENTMVVLPKSKQELTILQLVNAVDTDGKPKLANSKDLVKVGEKEMSIEDFVKDHSRIAKELQNMKDEYCNEDEEDDDEDEEIENEEDEGASDKKEAKEDLKKVEKDEKKEIENKKKNKKKNSAEDKKAKEKADKLRNAAQNFAKNTPVSSMGTLERGKARYGS